MSFIGDIQSLNLPLGLLEEMDLDSFPKRASPREHVDYFAECMEAMKIMDVDNANASLCKEFLSTFKRNILCWFKFITTSSIVDWERFSQLLLYEFSECNKGKLPKRGRTFRKGILIKA